MVVALGLAASVFTLRHASPVREALHWLGRDMEKPELVVVGALAHSFPAAKFVVMVVGEPCTKENFMALRPLGIDTVEGDSVELAFGLEAILEEEDVAFLCAVALDGGGRAVALGASARLGVSHPAGVESGQALGVKLTLEALPAPIRLAQPLL